MADIELVIRIPEGLKKDFELERWTALSCMEMKNALEKATLLPKGHGDLIDRRELKKEVYTTTEWNGDVHRIIYEASVDDASPIIEADIAK